MAPTLETPVLVVDTDLIHKVDTRNVENLFSMWTVFSRCAGSVEQGRRLENLSWRLWNRETFCCQPASQMETPRISPKLSITDGHQSLSIPDLSGSVDSLAEVESAELNGSIGSQSAQNISRLNRPTILRQDSSASNLSRGRERHINPDDLEKMVIAIKHTSPETIAQQASLDLTPLAPCSSRYVSDNSNTLTKSISMGPIPMLTSSSDATACSLVSDAGPHAEDSSQTELSNESPSPGNNSSNMSIVRGFEVGVLSTSFRAHPLPYDPEIPGSKSASPPKRGETGVKKGTMFSVGPSPYSDSEFAKRSTHRDDGRSQRNKNKNKAVFAFGGSSGEDANSFSQHMESNMPQHSSPKPYFEMVPKKQTSFLEEVAARTIQEEGFMVDDVFETDDEDDIDESAIEEADSSEWEDSIEDSKVNSVDDTSFFKRVDSRPNLTSRRSMLTTLLHQEDRAAALGKLTSHSQPAMHRSRTSSPHGPSLAASSGSDEDSALTMKRRIKHQQQSRAQPILKTNNEDTTVSSLTLSPRSTRRNMLSSELSQSLRRNLYWERQQKNSTASAVLKRRHTAHVDLKDMKDSQTKHAAPGGNNGLEGSNNLFDTGFGEYNSNGW